MQVVVAGASGLLGRSLCRHLTELGHQVTRLVRREAGVGESRWDPYAGFVDSDLIANADAVVNLAGSPTAGNPHSKKWARDLLDSRITTTAVLAEAISRTPKAAFLAGNGISFYGDHGNDEVTETSASHGDALLTRVTRQWQDATAPAAQAGARVVVLRTAPVMDRAAPPLAPLRHLARFGLSTRLGSGHQYFPMISLRDWVGGVSYALTHPTLDGPVNLCCPVTPTNAEFTRALADAVHRPAFLVAPAPVIKVAAGAMAPEVLGSLRAVPAALQEAGYQFRDVDVRDVIAAGLNH